MSSLGKLGREYGLFMDRSTPKSGESGRHGSRPLESMNFVENLKTKGGYDIILELQSSESKLRKIIDRLRSENASLDYDAAKGKGHMRKIRDVQTTDETTENLDAPPSPFTFVKSRQDTSKGARPKAGSYGASATREQRTPTMKFQDSTYTHPNRKTRGTRPQYPNTGARSNRQRYGDRDWGSIRDNLGQRPPGSWSGQQKNSDIDCGSARGNLGQRPPGPWPGQQKSSNIKRGSVRGNLGQRPQGSWSGRQRYKDSDWEAVRNSMGKGCTTEESKSTTSAMLDQEPDQDSQATEKNLAK